MNKLLLLLSNNFIIMLIHSNEITDQMTIKKSAEDN